MLSSQPPQVVISNPAAAAGGRAGNNYTQANPATRPIIAATALSFLGWIFALVAWYGPWAVFGGGSGAITYYLNKICGSVLGSSVTTCYSLTEFASISAQIALITAGFALLHLAWLSMLGCVIISLLMWRRPFSFPTVANTPGLITLSAIAMFCFAAGTGIAGSGYGGFSIAMPWGAGLYLGAIGSIVALATLVAAVIARRQLAGSRLATCCGK